MKEPRQRKGTVMQAAEHAGQTVLARDLIDFYLRWSEFRQQAQAVAGKDTLSRDERETIGWLIKLADRVGTRDLV